MRYDVVWPLGRIVTPCVPARPGVLDLGRKTVGELWQGLNRGDEIFPVLREKLGERFPGISFVEIKYPRGWDEKEVLPRLPELLRAHGCDLVISGVGGSPGTTCAAVRASMEAERAGIPAVTIVASAHLVQGKALARGLGVVDAAIAEYPGILAIDDPATLKKKVEAVLTDGIVEGFGKPIEVQAQAESFRDTDIVFNGNFPEIQEFFYEKQWTDGLPIVPPTLEEVGRFLKFTDSAADQVIGVVAIESREATVWNVAVNAVMAGCRPEYMPVLIAIVEAIADPAFRVEGAGSSTGWEPLIILNGPIIKQLGFNCGTGVLRAGRRANTSIGRFLRLIMTNIVGCRLPPGAGDSGATAGMFNAVLAEDEDSVADAGWAPFSVDAGFPEGENVVTVQSAMGGGAPFYPGGERALDHAQAIAAIWGTTCSHWAWQTMLFGKSFPLLVISKRIAAALAKDGWTKKDLREYLARQVKVSARASERWALHTTGSAFSIADWVARGLLPPQYRETTDPERLVPVFLRPEYIGIVLAGDPLRNQARGFVSSTIDGMRVSKRIELPSCWESWLDGRQRAPAGF